MADKFQISLLSYPVAELLKIWPETLESRAQDIRGRRHIDLNRIATWKEDETSSLSIPSGLQVLLFVSPSAPETVPMSKYCTVRTAEEAGDEVLAQNGNISSVLSNPSPAEKRTLKEFGINVEEPLESR